MPTTERPPATATSEREAYRRLLAGLQALDVHDRAAILQPVADHFSGADVHLYTPSVRSDIVSSFGQVHLAVSTDRVNGTGPAFVCDVVTADIDWRTADSDELIDLVTRPENGHLLPRCAVWLALQRLPDEPNSNNRLFRSERTALLRTLAAATPLLDCEELGQLAAGWEGTLGELQDAAALAH